MDPQREQLARQIPIFFLENGINWLPSQNTSQTMASSRSSGQANSSGFSDPSEIQGNRDFQGPQLRQGSGSYEYTGSEYTRSLNAKLCSPKLHEYLNSEVIEEEEEEEEDREKEEEKDEEKDEKKKHVPRKVFNLEIKQLKNKGGQLESFTIRRINQMEASLKEHFEKRFEELEKKLRSDFQHDLQVIKTEYDDELEQIKNAQRPPKKKSRAIKSSSQKSQESHQPGEKREKMKKKLRMKEEKPKSIISLEKPPVSRQK